MTLDTCMSNMTLDTCLYRHMCLTSYLTYMSNLCTDISNKCQTYTDISNKYQTYVLTLATNVKLMY